MMKYLRTLLTYLLILGQITWGNLAYAGSIEPENITGLQPPARPVYYQHIRRNEGVYNVSLGTSLRSVAEPIVLVDHDTKTPLGRITNDGDCFKIFLSSLDHFVISGLIHSPTEIVHEGGVLTVNGDVQCDLYAKAKKLIFNQAITCHHQIDVLADELETQDISARSLIFRLGSFSNVHRLYADHVDITAQKASNGLNTESKLTSGQLLGRNSLSLSGDWVNYGTLASTGDITIGGDAFSNSENAEVITGNSFRNSAKQYTDHGNIFSGLPSFIRTETTSIGATFNFIGRALGIKTEEFDSALSCLHQLKEGESPLGKILVRDFFLLDAAHTKATQGVIYQDTSYDTDREVYSRLMGVFGGFEKPTRLAQVVQECVGIRSGDCLVSFFDIHVKDRGSIFLEGEEVEACGEMQHGLDANSETVIIANQKAVLRSKKVGERVRVFAPTKSIERSDETNNEPIELTSLELIGTGSGVTSSLVQEPLILNRLIIRDTGQVELDEYIIGHEGKESPDVLVVGQNIQVDINHLRARLLHLKASNKLSYIVLEDAFIERGVMEAGESIVIGGHNASLEAFGGLLVKAPGKSIWGLDVRAGKLETEGESLLLAAREVTSDAMSSKEKTSVLSTANLNIGILDVSTGSFRQLGSTKVGQATINAEETLRFFGQLAGDQVALSTKGDMYLADLRAKVAKLHSVGDMFVSAAASDVIKAHADGKMSFGDISAQRAELDAVGDIILSALRSESMRAQAGGKISSSGELLLQTGALSAAEVNLAALDAVRATISTSAGAYIGHASGGDVSVSAKGDVLVSESTAKAVNIESKEGGASVLRAVDADTLHVEGPKWATANVQNVGHVKIKSKDGTASASGSAGTLIQEGSTTSASDVEAGTITQNATTYAVLQGTVANVTQSAPISAVAGGSKISRLNVSESGDVFLNTEGETLRIGTLQATGGKTTLHTTGTTLIETAEVEGKGISNRGTLTFTKAILALQHLLNFAQMQFNTPSSLEVGSVMSNTGTITGKGTLDLHLEHQHGMGNISAEQMSSLVQNIPLQGRNLTYLTSGSTIPETFIEEVMGTEDNQCGFFALDTTRDDGVNVLLHHMDNPKIRHLIGHELYRGLVENERSIDAQFYQAADVFLNAIHGLEDAIRKSEAEHRQLQTLAHEAASPENIEKIRVGEQQITRLILQLDNAKHALQEWCESVDVCSYYIKYTLGRSEGVSTEHTSGYMLPVECGFGSTPLGSLDAIAALQGYRLEVYTVDGHDSTGNPLLACIHKFEPTEYGFTGDFKTRRIVLTSADVATAPSALNHYNVLRTQEEAEQWQAHFVQDQSTGKLNIRLNTSHLPARIIGDQNITAADHVNWFLQGQQNFSRPVTVSQRTYVYVEGDVSIDGDITALGDFGISGHNVKIKSATVESKGALGVYAMKGDVDTLHAALKSDGPQHISAVGSAGFKDTKMTAGDDLTLESTVDVVLESLSKRHGDDQNYHSEKQATSVKTDGTFTVEAGHNIVFKGAETKSKEGTVFNAGGQIVDIPLALERQTYQHLRGGFSRHKYVRQEVSSHESDGVIVSTAAAAQELYAPVMRGLALLISGAHGINSHAVQDTHEYECREKRDSGNVLGGTKTVSAAGYSAHGKGAIFQAQDYVKFITELGDVTLEGVKVQAPKAAMEALNGIVRIRAATNESAHSSFVTKSNVAWQSYKSVQEKHKTYTASEFSGVIDIASKETIVDQVQGQTVEWINRINQQGGDFKTNLLRELHTYESKSGGGPTPALAAVIVIAITIATQGAGSSLGASLVGSNGLGLTVAGTTTLTATGTFVAGMTAGAFTTICTQAGVALLQAEGDIGKAAKSLLTKDSIKNLAVASVTAGLSKGLFNTTGISTTPETFGGFVAKTALESTAHTAAGVALRGTSLEDALRDSVRPALVTAAASYLAYNIGLAYEDGNNGTIGYGAHKVLHAVVASGGSWALGATPEQAAIIGASTAIAEATVEGLIAGDSTGTGMRSGGTEAGASGIQEHVILVNPSTGQVTHSAVPEGLLAPRNIGHLVGAMLGGLATDRVDLASTMAAIAIDNNTMYTRARKIVKSLWKPNLEEQAATEQKEMDGNRGEKPKSIGNTFDPLSSSPPHCEKAPNGTKICLERSRDLERDKHIVSEVKGAINLWHEIFMRNPVSARFWKKDATVSIFIGQDDARDFIDRPYHRRLFSYHSLNFPEVMKIPGIRDKLLIIHHETAHAVLSKARPDLHLDGRYDACALQESFSDITGILISLKKNPQEALGVLTSGDVSYFYNRGNLEAPCSSYHQDSHALTHFFFKAAGKIYRDASSMGPESALEKTKRIFAQAILDKSADSMPKVARRMVEIAPELSAVLESSKKYLIKCPPQKSALHNFAPSKGSGVDR